MALKLPDSAVPMGDFPVAKAVDIDFDDGENLQEKLDNGKLGGGGSTGGATTYTSLDELGLTADATIDDVIGALKDGETAIITTSDFTNYLTMFPNQCTNDQYAVIKVERKNGNICFIEWRQKEGNAYAIGGLNGSNKFTNWNNLVRFKKDGFADDSIVCIGDTVGSDGVTQTLEKLGFSNDILTWDTGVYRISDVGGLTNLPSGVKNAKPAFRLEHYNIKKWSSNHNPNTKTWAQRHSVIYCDNTEVYHRFYESGNTAGTYIRDTGWQKIATQKDLDELFQSVSSGKTLVANAITDKGVSTATDATFATMATNISKITNYTASEKQALATAITGKGVSTSSTDSFSTMATNISKININGYKEETVSCNNTSVSANRLVFTFSADVYGVKQITPPSDASSHIVPETSTSMFTINGRKLTLYVNGVGTWEVTAIVRNA